MTADLAHWDAGVAPRVDPLAYPGRWPPRSVLLTGGGLLPLDLGPGGGLDGARVGGGPLADTLLGQGGAPVGERTPVLAVGSNASPAQLWHKFGVAGVSPVIPLVRVHVEGLAAGVAAYVARAGYVPATPVRGPELTAELFVQWLDADQLTRLDATEPNYRRLLLPTGAVAEGGVRITLPSGQMLDTCAVYAGTRGHLHLGDGAGPRLLDNGDQAMLLAQLLAASPRLRRLMGDTPASWIERATRPGVADAVRATFRAEGWVRQPPPVSPDQKFMAVRATQ